MTSPKKSILKQTTINTNPTSWFSSKFNNNEPTTPPISPRINNLFSSFRKQQQPSQSLQPKPSVEDLTVVSNELNQKELRRVRFPVTDITQEFVFLREDVITEKNIKKRVMEPVQITTCAQLLSLYELVCRNKGENTIDLVVSTLITQPQATCITKLDLTNQAINRFTIDPLCDIMCIDFGIRELTLSNCGLEDDAVKILMHSLLENDKITHLNLSNNIKISTPGFKYIAVYIKGSKSLTNLDLSYTLPDKKSIQYITSGTSTSSLTTLLLNGCGLRNAQLEVLANGIKKCNSSIQQLYLRSNKFMGGGAVSIGVMLRDYDSEDGTKSQLTRLYLDNNDFGQGIQYIAQALRRNQSLTTLSICDCKIDAKGCVLMGEALKYNQCLERFDIGFNPLCTPNVDGIRSICQAINVNRYLKDLRLSDTGLSTESTIALAECLSENKSLIRLDISRNYIDYAGLLALSVSIRMNHTLTFIDIHIPTDNKDMVNIHNDILAICTRNAAEKTDSNHKKQQQEAPQLITAQSTARLTLEERLAAVTKGKHNTWVPITSEIVVTTKKSRDKAAVARKKKAVNEDTQLIQQAFDVVATLENVLTDTSSSIQTTSNSSSIEDMSTTFDLAKQVQANLCNRVPFISDPSQLEILLALNDRLTTAIQSYTAAIEEEKQEKQLEQGASSSSSSSAIDITLTAKEKEEELSSSFEIGDDDDDDEDDMDEEEYENHLKELKNEIEAEESAAFLKAKQQELLEQQEEEEAKSSSSSSSSTSEVEIAVIAVNSE